MPVSDQDFAKPLTALLNARGYRGKIVSIARVKALETEIMTRRRTGLLQPELYQAYLASFDFTCYREFKDAQSLIVVSAPQPQVQVTFIRKEKPYPVIIPPTYSFDTDTDVENLLKAYLQPQAYRLKKVRLPEKLLAVHSGLAQYGKNNITYVNGMGSFHRLVVFISSVPCAQDDWREPTVLNQCQDCHACANACPTDAIGSDRFQLYAERCLTFHNEGSRDFPEWLSPEWHNSLVGCMICQKACPANKAAIKWMTIGPTFSIEETGYILNRVSDKRLPQETIEKLKTQGIMEYYPVLARNLRALIEKSG
jgi:epoxyqueuosine reductase